MYLPFLPVSTHVDVYSKDNDKTGMSNVIKVNTNNVEVKDTKYCKRKLLMAPRVLVRPLVANLIKCIIINYSILISLFITVDF